MIVVDTNILAYLYLGREHHHAVASLVVWDDSWAAPLLWRSEFRNVLVGCVRRGELALAEARDTQAEAEDLMRDGEFEVDSGLVLDLAQSSGCSAYDCEYVALAIHLGVKLVTTDRAILRAFPHVAVPLEGAV